MNLISLLKEKKINFNETTIKEKIEEIKRDMETDKFEKKLTSEEYRSVSMEDLDLMSGHEFENFLKILFEKMGYRVERTKLTSDQGADLIISKFGEKVVVQAKRYGNKVNNKAIQEVVASIKHYNAERGMVVTTNEFTRSAAELADSNNIDLIDGYKLEKLIQKFF